MTRRLIALTLFAAALAAGPLAAGCSTTTKVALVNPTDQPLFVQINERAPVEVAAGTTVKTSLPALDRLTPLAITARDRDGNTVVFLSTSLPRLEANGNRVELVLSGEPIDPLANPSFQIPVPNVTPLAN